MNRSAIITGATRGIGKGIFDRLSGNGCHVATIYHEDESAAQGLREKAKRLGIQCLVERVDIRNLSALTEFVGSVHHTFGRIDYLINNVGIDSAGLVADLSFEEWKQSQDIILNGPFVLSKAVLPYMRQQKFGRIINIGASSKDYYKGAPELAAFGIHKAALMVLTKTVAMEEIGNGITVNMVAPGSTDGAGTLPENERIPISSIPLGRRVLVEEVVDAVMYFLSDSANSVTGQVLEVNAGLST